MMLRSLRTYRTRSGKLRKIRLYESWQNIHRRVRGTTYAGSGQNYWVGLPVEWPDFESFREWALANGYSRKRNSLDRIDTTKGYGPDNCRWVSVAENTAYQNLCRGLQKIPGTPGDPVNYPDVPF